MLRSAHHPISVSLMKALSLSKSTPLDALVGKRQLSAYGFQSLDHQGLFPFQQGNGLWPTSADVGGHQAVGEIAGHRTTKLDKIKNLHTKDTIATEGCTTRGRSIWMPACKITGTYASFSDGSNLTVDGTVFELLLAL